jgi:hypothetical protein
MADLRHLAHLSNSREIGAAPNPSGRLDPDHGTEVDMFVGVCMDANMTERWR